MTEKGYESFYCAVEKRPCGYYALKPSYLQEMRRFYEEEYFQIDHANYKKEYDPIDQEYQRNTFWMKMEIYLAQMGQVECADTAHSDGHLKKFLDIGCGEGYALAYFHRAGWEVAGIDLSSYGVETHNPKMKEFLMQGDFEEIICKLEKQKKCFDFINADNIFEHIPNPEKLLADIRKLCHKGTVICINVPNDFSIMQRLAYEMGQIDSAFWVTEKTCEHINYFSLDSFTMLGESLGYERITATADWPVDFFLLNPESNYRSPELNQQQKADMGHNAHVACVTLENELIKLSPEKALALRKAIASCGIGRDFSIYLRIKTE